MTGKKKTYRLKKRSLKKAGGIYDNTFSLNQEKIDNALNYVPPPKNRPPPPEPPKLSEPNLSKNNELYLKYRESYDTLSVKIHMAIKYFVKIRKKINEK